MVFPVLSLMPVWALVIICLLLKKGQLCPGQRSRFQGELITVWTILFVALMMGVESAIAGWILIVGALGSAYGVLLSIWQGKLPGKRSIPDKAIYFSLVPLSIFGFGVLCSQPSAFAVLPMIITGTVLAHLLLVKAKSRLQAFNKILPFVGVAAVLVSLIVVMIMLASGSEVNLTNEQLNDFMWFIGILVAGIALWLLPALSTNPQSHTLLGIATLLILVSQILATELVVNLG
jgi:hypothetical protein